MISIFDLFKFANTAPFLVRIPQELSPLKVPSLAIIGSTFSVKDKISKLGFVWSRYFKVSIDGNDISGAWITGEDKIISIEDLKEKLIALNIKVDLDSPHQLGEINVAPPDGIVAFFDSSSNSVVVAGDTKPVKEILKSMGFTYKATIYPGPEGIKYSPVWAKRLKLSKEEITKLKELNPKILNDIEDKTETQEGVKSAVEIKNQISSDSSISGISHLIENFVHEIHDKMFSKNTEESISMIKKMLNFQSAFNKFSFYNQILMFMQDNDATEVATAKQWETDFGRKISTEAIPIVVLRPVGQIIRLTDAEKQRLRAKGVSELVIKRKDNRVINPRSFSDYIVYDVRFTSPVEGRADFYDPSKNELAYGTNDTSEHIDKLIEAAISVAQEEYHIHIDIQGAGKSLGSSQSDGNININKDSHGVRALGTIIHELTHEIVHDIGYREKKSLKSYAAGEIQAEGMSYMVLKYFKVPFDFEQSCINYMRIWNSMDKSELLNSLKNITKEAGEIINKIESRMN